jgi:ureidoglycolate dehydrogenase
MRVEEQKLHELISNKLQKAGLLKEHADITSDILTWSDARGIHSHGAVRVEYYSERIAKGGITNNPKFEFKRTGPASGIFEGDNGCGYVAATLAMKEAIEMAKESGVAVVGARQISHSGSLGYYAEMAAQEDLIAITMCQSDPMAVPYGGAEPYYGTNPIAFGAPGVDGRNIIFDMATTVQAWGKVLHARSQKKPIPDTWAVDEDGKPTTDPMKVNALVPIAEAKGYGLMMMVDIFSGILLGVPFGKHVSSMYDDLSKGRDLGHLHIVLDPKKFAGIDNFKENITQTMEELAQIKPAEGFDKVYYPGERGLLRKAKYDGPGIEIVDDIYNYLISEEVHFNRYDHKNRFAE